MTVAIHAATVVPINPPRTASGVLAITIGNFAESILYFNVIENGHSFGSDDMLQ